MRWCPQRAPTKRRRYLRIVKTSDVIVTDINLPGTMNGLRLAAAVKARRPAINIVIVTGYSAPKADELPPGSFSFQNHTVPKR